MKVKQDYKYHFEQVIWESEVALNYSCIPKFTHIICNPSKIVYHLGDQEAPDNWVKVSMLYYVNPSKVITSSLPSKPLQAPTLQIQFAAKRHLPGTWQTSVTKTKIPALAC